MTEYPSRSLSCTIAILTVITPPAWFIMMSATWGERQKYQGGGSGGRKAAEKFWRSPQVALAITNQDGGRPVETCELDNHMRRWGM